MTQNIAHYKKEETDANKQTYPLPPFSTVIGAIHKACEFKEYKPMDLSIQGNYKSLSKQPYTDHSFFDSIQDDRGVLVKLVSNNIQSKAFIKVAKAKRGQGNSFRQGITIDVYDEILLNEYRELKALNERLSGIKKRKLDPTFLLINKRKKTLKEKKKSYDKDTLKYKEIVAREEEIKKKEKFIKETFEEYKFKNYTKKISKFQTLSTSIKYYEVLHEVKLIIHAKADHETLEILKNNIYNLKSIGRSEDFVDIIECKYVTLKEKISKPIKSQYSTYLNYEVLKKNQSLLFKNKNISGTVFWINKRYDNSKGFRDFEKVKVFYTSNIYVNHLTKDIYYDGEYVINFN